MNGRLLVVGSVAFDTVQTRHGKREDILGGAATYIALAASHFCGVDLVGVVGEGDFPEEHVRLLTDRGVDVRGLERREGRTFRWSGVYADDFSSRETLDTQLGVFADFAPKIPEEYLEASAVMLGNIHPALQLQVLDQIGSGRYVAADTMNLWIETTPDELAEVISRVDLLLINDEEAAQLTGELQVRIAARRLLERGPSAVVIKRGEHGAWLFTEETVFFTPALPLPEVIDPTGAGDTFAGGLIGHLTGAGGASPQEIRRGMHRGTALASATVEGFGVEALAAMDQQGIRRRLAEISALVSLD